MINLPLGTRTLAREDYIHECYKVNDVNINLTQRIQLVTAEGFIKMQYTNSAEQEKIYHMSVKLVRGHRERSPPQ